MESRAIFPIGGVKGYRFAIEGGINFDRGRETIAALYKRQRKTIRFI